MKLAHLVAAAAFAPAFAAAADFSGTWTLDNTFNGRVSAIHCTLVQAGDALSGSCKPAVAGMEASKLTGTVAGSNAKWGYDLVFNGQPARVDYEVAMAVDGAVAGNLLRNGSGSPIKGVRTACDPAGALQFICGPRNAEDLVLVPGTGWVIASGGTEGTNFYLIDSAKKSWQPLPFDVRRNPAYTRCPGPPVPATLQTHGLHIRARLEGGATLHVVSHGARESIEVFTVDLLDGTPRLSWNGCLVLPEGLVANSVASLADGSLLATILFLPGRTFAEAMIGTATGVVVAVAPGRETFEVVRGTELPANNGIEVSPDGREFYVVSSGLRTVVAFARGNPAKRLRSTRVLPFTPDNVHRGPDGRLYSAGMAINVPACGGTPGPQHNLQQLAACPRGSVAAAIDARTMRETLIVETPPVSAFSNATMVLPIGTQFWLGTFSGERIAHGTLPSRRR